MVIDGNSNNHGKHLIIGGVTAIEGVTYWIMYYYQTHHSNNNSKNQTEPNNGFSSKIILLYSNEFMTVVIIPLMLLCYYYYCTVLPIWKHTKSVIFWWSSYVDSPTGAPSANQWVCQCWICRAL